MIRTTIPSREPREPETLPRSYLRLGFRQDLATNVERIRGPNMKVTAKRNVQPGRFLLGLLAIAAMAGCWQCTGPLPISVLKAAEPAEPASSPGAVNEK